MEPGSRDALRRFFVFSRFYELIPARCSSCWNGVPVTFAAVPVLPGDTEETLGARVLEQEHIIYPKAVQLYCEGRLKVEGRHVHILEGDNK